MSRYGFEHSALGGLELAIRLPTQIRTPLPSRGTQVTRHYAHPIPGTKSLAQQGLPERLASLRPCVTTPTTENHSPLPPRGGTDVRRTCPLPLAQPRYVTSETTPTPPSEAAIPGCLEDGGDHVTQTPFRESLLISRDLARLVFSSCPSPAFLPSPPRRRSFSFSDGASS